MEFLLLSVILVLAAITLALGFVILDDLMFDGRILDRLLED